MQASGSKKARGVRPQRLRNPVERLEARRGLPGLDPAEVGALDARHAGQLVLSQLPVETEGTNGLSEGLCVAHGVTPNTSSGVLQLTHYSSPQAGRAGLPS